MPAIEVRPLARTRVWKQLKRFHQKSLVFPAHHHFSLFLAHPDRYSNMQALCCNGKCSAGRPLRCCPPARGASTRAPRLGKQLTGGVLLQRGTVEVDPTLSCFANIVSTPPAPAGHRVQQVPRPCSPSGDSPGGPGGPPPPPPSDTSGKDGGGGGAGSSIAVTLAPAKRWLYDHAVDGVVAISLALLYKEIKDLKADIKADIKDTKADIMDTKAELNHRFDKIEDRLWQLATCNTPGGGDTPAAGRTAP